MTKILLSGNEAIARGAYEGGVTLAVGYPGTPSTEILETIADNYHHTIYAEWSPNEKVAFEVAAGASLTGARVIVTMKHVGLNVAADPLMTLAYLGVVGGFVAVVADDPGMHSSQNEQDTRHFARFAKIPLLEPADSEEAKEWVKVALQISEEFQTPVILRTTTRIAHSRSLVEELPRQESDKPIRFEKNPTHFVAIPAWARPMRIRLEERLQKLQQYGEHSPINATIMQDKKLGIITSGIAYQYVREMFPNASILKLGMPFPFPDALIRTFAASVETLLVVEELDDFLEEHINALGIACTGKELISNIGELSPDDLRIQTGNIVTNSTQASNTVVRSIPTAFDSLLPDTPLPATSLPVPVPALPNRPPVLCPGCPHRGIFYALGQLDVVVVGDIGCYSLGVLPPLSRIDTLLCMGGGVSMTHGMDKAQRNNPERQKIVGIVGDSTFFHSGMTGLLNIAYNKGTSTIIVVDNRITAMTGHQDNPGTGKTLLGEPTAEASIESIGMACGIRHVRTVDPSDIKSVVSILKEATASPEPWLILSKSPCPLYLKRLSSQQLPSQKLPVKPLSVDEAKCKKCDLCLQLGCPGLEKVDGHVQINALLCEGCTMCRHVCPVKAIR